MKTNPRRPILKPPDLRAQTGGQLGLLLDALHLRLEDGVQPPRELELLLQHPQRLLLPEQLLFCSLNIV